MIKQTAGRAGLVPRVAAAFQGIAVYIAPEVKPWHGAAADEWFTHVAIEIPAEGASNEWLEPVNDAQYSQLDQ